MKTLPVCSALFCAALMVLVGCASRPKASKNYDAAYIDYSMPFTSIQFAARAVLTECEGSPRAKIEASLIPVASASPYPEHRMRIKGEDLVSFSKKRDLKIELYQHDAIKSINASVADRSGAILVNVLKVATLLAAAPQPGNVKGKCNANTMAALARSKKLKGDLAILRSNLEKTPEKTMKQIDAITAEVGRIEAGQLTLTLNQLIVIDQDQIGGVMAWSRSDLAKWFDLEAGASPDNFKMAWCIFDWVPNSPPPACRAQIAMAQKHVYEQAKQKGGASWVAKPACPDNDCAASIVFRDPKVVEMVITSTGGDLSGDSPNTLGRLKFPLPQSGTFTYFPLKVGFGGSKSLALTLDEFGRRTSFGWSSGARGEEITGGAQSIAEAASAWQTSKETSDIKQDKATIDELETKKKLNQLEACRATIEAGGFTCPGQ